MRDVEVVRGADSEIGGKNCGGTCQLILTRGPLGVVRDPVCHECKQPDARGPQWSLEKDGDNR